MPFDNQTLALSTTGVLGGLTLILVFRQMKGGFGPFNLRVVGIVLVATFAAILGIIDGSKMTASIGILGAIVGYLFGFKTTGEKQP